MIILIFVVEEWIGKSIFSLLVPPNPPKKKYLLVHLMGA